ncbi:hypothetical protein [Streptomyces iconiensis]|uniref:Uncharacterized protein n=1 Tax=Streptomyces iconiensis TaxID=1384038 RepID=A0ABT7A2Q3_9ACTN|nr:hypothetical protein [Streptomyces iconiensis]MDJ1134893.1 hypothetical protein [Streptomyces iconiensis]
MSTRTQALRRAVEHPLVRLAAVALLQAAAEHLAQPRTATGTGPRAGSGSCARACGRAAS